jgi:hypothetical protein
LYCLSQGANDQASPARRVRGRALVPKKTPTTGFRADPSGASRVRCKPVLAPPTPHHPPRHHNLPRRQGNVPHNQETPQPKPTPATITLQRPNSPRRRTSLLTSLTDPPRQPTLQRPAPSDSRPNGSISTSRKPRTSAVTNTCYRRWNTRTNPQALSAPNSSFRPTTAFELQGAPPATTTRRCSKPPALSAPSSSRRPQCGVRLQRHPTGHDNAATLKTASTALQSLAFQRAPRPAK